jgi:hypothetical protein
MSGPGDIGTGRAEPPRFSSERPSAALADEAAKGTAAVVVEELTKLIGNRSVDPILAS